MTPRLSPMDMDMERETLRLKLMLSQDMEAKGTPQDPSASNMLRRCATRSHNRIREKFQDQCARLLLTQPTLKSVRRPSQPSALRRINRSITAQPLLVMTPRLSAMELLELTTRDPLSPQRDTAMDLNANNMLRDNATRFPNSMREKCQDQFATRCQDNSATQLLTRLPEKCVNLMDMDMDMEDMDMVMDTMESNSLYLICLTQNYRLLNK